MIKIIFFGNGPLADITKQLLEENQNCQIIFHAKRKEDLDVVKHLKLTNPDTFGILASFGTLIKSDLLKLFEPTGILNLHPSLLPKYRGASPIETAILNGDRDFSISIMKLVKAMDAGPIYYQTTIKSHDFSSPFQTNLKSTTNFLHVQQNGLSDILIICLKPLYKMNQRQLIHTNLIPPCHN